MVAGISPVVPGVGITDPQGPGAAHPPPRQVQTEPTRPEPTRLKAAADAASPRQGQDASKPKLTAFASLAGVKEEAQAVAQSVREGARVLDRAAELVQAMRREALAILKNYPPFPPGAEERRQYLESIAALRRQMEALIVPPEARPAQGLPLPVGQRLPVLDPGDATDGEVEGFYQALDRLDQELMQARQSLYDLVVGLSMWPQEVSPGVLAPAHADTVSQRASQALAQAGQPIASNPQALRVAGLF